VCGRTGTNLSGTFGSFNQAFVCLLDRSEMHPVGELRVLFVFVRMTDQCLLLVCLLDLLGINGRTSDPQNTMIAFL
jgi:hypothetical protein